MKQYKFIGTEQDLIDNGYCKALGDYTYWYMKPCKGRKILIRKYDKHINFPDIKDIQDLIVKGLVVEIKELEK